jgi:dTDP-4-dehydrorhamnose 3,5-epimerase
MKIIETQLSDLVVLEPKKIEDSRGFFLETYRDDVLKDAGIVENFVQDNHSRSTRGVLRGLHYQLTHPQGKLVRVAKGSVFDVAVDIRKGSSTFGQWFGAELNEENMRMMYIPVGFAHGFVVLSDTADFIYKCTDYYCPQSEQGILWNDPDIGVDWKISDVHLSKRDSEYPLLKDQSLELLPDYNETKL